MRCYALRSDHFASWEHGGEGFWIWAQSVVLGRGVVWEVARHGDDEVAALWHQRGEVVRQCFRCVHVFEEVGAKHRVDAEGGQLLDERVVAEVSCGVHAWSGNQVGVHDSICQFIQHFHELGLVWLDALPHLIVATADVEQNPKAVGNMFAGCAGQPRCFLGEHSHPDRPLCMNFTHCFGHAVPTTFVGEIRGCTRAKTRTVYMSMKNPTRIMVTGGAGFIGSNYLHHRLHAAGAADDCCAGEELLGSSEGELQVLNLDVLTYAADPRNLDGVSGDSQYQFQQTDIRDANAVRRAVADFKPEAIVHFAAESHVDRSIEGGGVFVETNVLGTQNLLDAARINDVETFIHVSTDEVYGTIDEGSFVEGDPYEPGSPYAASKAGSDLMALAHHNTYGIDVRVTRCTNNYGPRQHPEKLVPKAITRIAAGESMPVYGSGKNVRDWLYVLDHCRAIDAVLARGAPGEVYNIAGREEKTNLEILDVLLGAFGAGRERLEFVADRLGHDWRYSLDDSKLRALGWAPRVAFEAGMRRTIDWYTGRKAA